MSVRDALAQRRDIVLITLDSLRFDVAQQCLEAGRSPVLAGLAGSAGWERRHSPATFTFAAHQAFFAGFLPTPAAQPLAQRQMALRFAGSRSVGPGTAVFDAPDIVSGLAAEGYRTVCIGGTGFFDRRTPLSRVLPGLFAEAHWNPGMGVASPASPGRQVACACEALARAGSQPVFLFINAAATHAPTRIFLPGAGRDSPQTQAAALSAFDTALPPLLAALAGRGGAFIIVTADHGEAFGEDGLFGHRLAHPVVTDVPYAETMLTGEAP